MEITEPARVYLGKLCYTDDGSLYGIQEQQMGMDIVTFLSVKIESKSPLFTKLMFKVKIDMILGG